MTKHKVALPALAVNFPAVGNLNGNMLMQIAARDYFADPCIEPSLSASIAHTLVTVSSLQAWADHPRLGGIPKTPSSTLERGDLFHALLLHAGKVVRIVKGCDDWKSARAREEREAARTAGLIPVLERQYDDAQHGCRIISRRLQDLGVRFDRKRSELGMLWIDHTSDGEPVQCRALVDNWCTDRATEYDLKSCSRPTRDLIASRIAEHGAHLQRAAYRRGLEANHPELLGRIQQRLIFFGTEPPYDVVPVRLSETFRAAGETLWQRALDLWATCRREDHWPGAVGDDEEMLIEPQPWHIRNATESERNSHASTTI